MVSGTEPNFPITWQRDPRHRWHKLGNLGRGPTIGGAGCALGCVASWVQWRYRPGLSLLRIQELLHTYQVLLGEDHTVMNWYGLAHVWPAATFDSSCWRNWRVRPADLRLLDFWLKAGPVIIEVDFKPATATVDQHFVVAIEWVDPCKRLQDRSLWVMDPWWGQIAIMPDAYYNKAWDRSVVVREYGKVARVITGARAVGHAWEVS